MNVSRLIIGALLGIGLAGMSAARAEAASPVCQLKDSIQAFAEARDDGSLRIELDSRKGLLYVINDCTKEEVRETIAILDELDITDASLLQAKDRLIERLKEEISFTDMQSSRIPEVGIEGTRDVARTIKEWRGNTHLPQIANANNFSLWNKNQNLIFIAEVRSRQIGQTLKNLKLNDRDGIKTHLAEADVFLGEAKQSNQKAKEALSRLENPETTARSLRNSFNSLSAAYNSFFKVSEEVKKILPL